MGYFVQSSVKMHVSNHRLTLFFSHSFFGWIGNGSRVVEVEVEVEVGVVAPKSSSVPKLGDVETDMLLRHKYHKRSS